MVKIIWMNKSLWLMHIDILLIKIVKKSILNIELPKRPIIKDNKGNDKTYRAWFYNGVERFIEINTLLFMEAFCYKLGFETFNSVIYITFNPIDPFVADKIIIRL